MSNDVTKKKELTEMQQKFLDVVMDEDHKGDIRKAMRTAGYSETTPSSVVINSLHEELTERAKKVIAANAMKATYSVLDVMENSKDLGAANKLKAAETILNRAGVKDKDSSSDINLKVPSGGLVILPAKSADPDVEVNAESD